MEASLGEKNLARDLSRHSGLDESFFNSEFNSLLEKYGRTADEITLADLREILAMEIQSLLLDLKSEN